MRDDPSRPTNRKLGTEYDEKGRAVRSARSRVARRMSGEREKAPEPLSRLGRT
jgi:hypothetical protein